jgi:hypothetical protein
MTEQIRGRKKDNSRKNPYEWAKRQAAVRLLRPKQTWDPEAKIWRKVPLTAPSFSANLLDK